MGAVVESGSRTLTETEIVKQFGDFYAAIHPGRRAYAWQKRLIAFVVRAGRWPDAISAPTGSGKTSVLYVHVFLNALAGHEDIAIPVPRRLVLSVGRRALVDSQFLEARELQKKLAESAEPLIARIREGLQKRAGGATDPADWLPLASFRGGAHDDRTEGQHAWRLHPAACAILCMTPDMVGSRLLFRGYGASIQARPIEAGLLTYDAVLIVDEAHLNEQLVVTARRVAQLEDLATDGVGVSPLQVVSTTATQASENNTSVGVTMDDCDQDPQLDRRLRLPKPVAVVDLEHSLADKRSVAAAVDECWRLRGLYPGGTVGCIVNSVDAAVKISAALAEKGGRVESIVGRMRPFDRDEIIRGHADLFGVEELAGDRESRPLDFLVATQTMEVGVDADFVALITELAPASALAQRAGRVNRRGDRESGPITVLAPRPGARRGPYRESDLERAREWLDELDERGLIAFGLAQVPSSTRRRMLLQRLEEWDAEYLASTSEQLSAESGETGESASDIELYLSDELDADMDASLIVRDGLPIDDQLAERILAAMPPREHERFPVSLITLKRILKIYLDDQAKSRPRVFRYIRTDAGAIEVRVSRPNDIRPGDTVVVDATAPLFQAKVPVEDGTECVDDLYHAAGGRAAPGTRGAFVVIPYGEGDTRRLWRTWDPIRREYEQIWTEDPERAAEYCAESVREHAGSSEAWKRMSGAAEVFSADGDAPSEIVVLAPDEEETILDEEVRQARAGNPTGAANGEEAAFNDEVRRVIPARVTLREHQKDVAERAGSLATSLGLPRSLISALKDAGAWHDEGKRDARFQLVLGNRAVDPERALAKSRVGRAAQRARRSSAGLSPGWRHEQRSAAYARAELQGDPAQVDLVTRLVGTTHGHGRGCFRDDASTLLPVAERTAARLWDAAVELYDRGEWESIIESTHRRYGYWGIAYLEAILRIADMTVSAEGK